jgi:predicted transcriptional regulator
MITNPLATPSYLPTMGPKTARRDKEVEELKKQIKDLTKDNEKLKARLKEKNEQISEQTCSLLQGNGACSKHTFEKEMLSMTCSSTFRRK